MHSQISWIRRGAVLLLISALAVVAAVACGDDDGGDEEAIGSLTFTATDYAFAVEGEPRPGPTNLVMPNEGEFEHYLLLFRIEGDHTMDELFDAMATIEEEGAEWPEWAVWKGGPSILSPGETAEMRVNLEAGHYAYMCPIGEDDPDGVPHVEKGMFGELTIEGDEYTGELPAADIEISGEDDGAGQSYVFNGVPESVDAGEAWVEFQNNGSEPHEMIALRVPSDYTLDDTIGILSGEVEPPEDFEYVALGGPAPILPGDRQQLQIDFQPGRYIFLCFYSNPEGIPHLALGMAAGAEVPPPSGGG